MAKRRSVQLPREHGFWVMMTAALVDSLGRAQWHWMGALAALVSAITAVIVAIYFRRAIRRKPWAQLASSASLALLVLPAQLIALVPWRLVLLDVIAWSSLFVACSLCVRATFARASRNTSASPTVLAGLSVLLPALTAAALWRDHPVTARIVIVGAIGTFAIALWQPVPKQLKPAGLALATVVVLAVVAHLV